MTKVSLYYWAGARAAAGVDSETVDADTVAEALDQARYRRADPYFDRVLAASSILVDGLICPPEGRRHSLPAPVRVEVLPPFAGGA